jgi:hypothetical protein
LFVQGSRTMTKLANLEGQRFGRGEAVILMPKEPGKNRKWMCVCDCGRVFVALTRSLKSGNSRSCGCLRNERSREHNRAKTKDYVGQTLGYITIHTQGWNEKGKSFCVGTCKCGTEVTVLTDSLLGGKSRSCGCLQKELAREHNRAKTKDYVGQVLGYITIHTQGWNEKGKSFCVGTCVCDAEVTVLTHSLLNGNTRSCGCVSRSYGEGFAEKLLVDAEIPFESEWNPEGGIYGNTLMRYDFKVGKILLEIDGEQHRTPVAAWGGVPKFIRTQNRDRRKNLWAAQHGYHLIRVPYHDRNKPSFDTAIEKIVARLQAEQQKRCPKQ